MWNFPSKAKSIKPRTTMMNRLPKKIVRAVIAAALRELHRFEDLAIGFN
jgi:hypothetical protein